MLFTVAPTWVTLGTELSAAFTAYFTYVILFGIAGWLLYKNYKENRQLKEQMKGSGKLR